MNLIRKKKIPFTVSSKLREYLKKYGRELPVIEYKDLLRYDNSIPLIDKEGVDTLWETVFYPQGDMEEIHNALKLVYANIQAHRDLSVITHLYIDRIDICPFGNSRPFRIRIVNNMNDNFDYFYVKQADASRIFGLELEHLLSPNRINYLVHKNTLIETHIAGVPGDQFERTYMKSKNLNKIRLAKEFVKFNERCFVRLLGDMHSSNFVVEITPDFEEIHYRIRAIDFDQQCYEGNKKIYMPQFFKQNNSFVKIGMEVMTPESMIQYQLEERSLIRMRIKNSAEPLNHLLNAMSGEKLSLNHHIEQLREDLAKHHRDNSFLRCDTMGQIVELNLRKLWDDQED